MDKTAKLLIVVLLAVAIVAVFALRQKGNADLPEGAGNSIAAPAAASGVSQNAGLATGKPRLVDLGSDTCVPCKMMAPILADLATQHAGTLDVQFLDVHKTPGYIAQYSIRVIPTQIFFDADGQELFRHEGFFSKNDILAKWAELGVDLAASEPATPAFERFTPTQADDRAKDTICYMCDGDVQPKTQVAVTTDKGPVRLCSPHCYFIMYSCLTEDKTGFEKKVSVTDWASGQSVPAADALFLYGQDETTGKPWIKAFASRADAIAERTANGGSLLALAPLQAKEMSHRCGFCERACYPQDAAKVVVAGGVHTWGCCSHCALGVAARTGKDIEVYEKDRLTGAPVVVKTFDGKVASLEPASAVAWFGQRQKPDGTWGSAGCFHQGFFTDADNLQKWVEKHPRETGKLISIHTALANKMKLSPEQIQKACKIGECVPK